MFRTQFVFKTHTSFAPLPVHLHLTDVLLLPAAQQRAARRAPSSAAELSAQPQRAPPLARPRAEHDALNPAAISAHAGPPPNPRARASPAPRLGPPRPAASAARGARKTPPRAGARHPTAAFPRGTVPLDDEPVFK